jgi:hypothetical protein
VDAVATDAARHAWTILLTHYTSSPQSALAELALGRRRLIDGDVPAADKLLRSAVERLGEIVASGAARDAVDPQERTFRRPAAWPPLGRYRAALFEARKLVWWIDENDVARDPEAASALGEYLAVGPYDVDRRARLGALAGKYEHTPLGDNLKLAVALCDDDAYERAQALVVLARDGGATDASIEACYELGQLAAAPALAPALSLLQDLRRPEWYYNVVRAARTNPWQAPAEEHLTWLQSTTQTRK